MRKRKKGCGDCYRQQHLHGWSLQGFALLLPWRKLPPLIRGNFLE
jgi:hypothetical protein